MPRLKKIGTPQICKTTDEALSAAVNLILRKGKGSNTNPVQLFIQGGAVTPTPLLQALATVVQENKTSFFRTFHIHLEGQLLHLQCPNITDLSFFAGANVRSAINGKANQEFPVRAKAEYVPIFLSEIPSLFRREIYDVDIALVQCSPPDKHGFVSLGCSVDVTAAAVETTKVIVALVNDKLPRTYGQGTLRMSNIDFAVHTSQPIYNSHKQGGDMTEKKIGEFIASEFVNDGSTLQLGIGGIPDAVLASCGDRKSLGIHSEMISDGVMKLMECGAITNHLKPYARGLTVTSFAIGSEDFYNFLDDNSAVAFLGADVTNDTALIRTMPSMTSINSAIEVDLTGQVVADTIGTQIYSGIGGQADFVRGAGLCPDGKSIIALPSRTKKGEARIVPFIKPGGAVVTTRGHVRYICTEFGIASLYGQPLEERCRRLISISHPDDREQLEKAAYERNILHRTCL